MYQRLKYLVFAICLVVVTVTAFICVDAAIRYNRAAGWFDASEIGAGRGVIGLPPLGPAAAGIARKAES